MLIALLIIIFVAIDSCDPVEDTPPIVGCPTMLCGTDCSDTSPFTASCSCPSGTIDVSFCPPTRDGGGPDGAPFPGDASCEEAPCFRPLECVTSCDEEPFYIGCCACPSGSFDRVDFCAVVPGEDAGVDGGGGLLGIGEPCFDDRQCTSGLCYGAVDASGGFGTPTCQAACLPPATTASYCLNDRHCCEGTCCVGCGEREGLCVTDTPPPPPMP
jgi:hypothetical protein